MGIASEILLMRLSSKKINAGPFNRISQLLASLSEPEYRRTRTVNKHSLITGHSIYCFHAGLYRFQNDVSTQIC